MLSLIRAVVDRLTAMLVTAAAQEAEAAVLARSAERQVELARLTQGYERDGQVQAAEQLRRQMAALDTARPLASVLPARDHGLVPESEKSSPASLPEPRRDEPAQIPPRRRSRR